MYTVVTIIKNIIIDSRNDRPRTVDGPAETTLTGSNELPYKRGRDEYIITFSNLVYIEMDIELPPISYNNYIPYFNI